METFAQLLSKHIKRAGISDAELARAIGVRRQTIFRWREGLTARPRHREDVLILARKLRLTPEEQDELLLSAGFSPENSPSPYEGEGWEGDETPTLPQSLPMREESFSPLTIETSASTPNQDQLTADSRPLWQRYAKLVISALLTAAVIGMAALAAAFIPPKPGTPTPTKLSGVITPAINRSPIGADIAPAQAGETLILVTKFVNYAGDKQGYNVAGRLSEALEQEITEAGLEDIRVALWPEEIDLRRYALRAGHAVSATLIIYGEYDAGRVMVRFAHPAAESDFIKAGLLREVSDLQSLSAVINSELPQQTRSLALMTLGQIYISQGNIDQALQVLQQASQSQKTDPTTDAQTRGTLNFYLGVAYHYSSPPQLDAAIAAYTEALTANPDLISALLNRSAAYHTRQRPGDFDLSLTGSDYVDGIKRIPVHSASLQEPGDLSLALNDANDVIRLAPDWAAAYNNRAAILIGLASPQAAKLAIKDLDKAIALDPTLVSARVNRAILLFQQGEPVEIWKPDLDETLTLEPERSAALNMLCWGYAVEGEPDLALPYCEKAIALDPRPMYIDSRGLTHALLGNTDQAIGDFETFTAWLAEQPGEGQQTLMLQRQDWIEALTAGDNPFTPELLETLRHQ